MPENKYAINIIDKIFILFFALYYILPDMSNRFNFLIPIVLGMGYMAYILFISRGSVNEVLKYFFLICFIALLYCFLTDTTTIAATASNKLFKRFISKYYQLFMMFLAVFLLKQVIDRGTLKQKKFFLAVSYLLYVYVVLITFRELAVNPNITKEWSEFAESSKNNIGNYYFVYAVPILIALCTSALLEYKKPILKILFALVIVFLFYFLLLAQYTLSVLISIIGIGLYVYNNAKTTVNKTLILLLFVFFAIAFPYIVLFAAKKVPSEQMSVRLYEIYHFFTDGDATGYNLNGRLELYKKSIVAFLKSPIWGNRSVNFDGHATFLTVLCDLGLLGGIPYFYLFRHSRKKVSSLINDPQNRFTPIYIMLVLMGLTNPIHMALPLMYAIWFVAPVSLDVFGENNINFGG